MALNAGLLKSETKIFVFLAMLAVSFFTGCSSSDSGETTAADPPPSDTTAPAPAPPSPPSPPTAVNVLTYHNDNARTGQNLQETLLTPANVNSTTFGKLFSYSVDGYVYAQPLYVSNVPVAGQLRNVVFVATEHNSVYAFDADNQAGAPLWRVSFIDPANGITTVPYQDTASPPGYTGPGPVIPGGCADLTPEIGISGTPVIDRATGTLYVVAKTKEINGAAVAYEHRLHALDIATGASRPGSGRALQASVPGTTSPNDGNGRVLFQSLRQNQRAALLLNKNIVSIAFSSHCVIRPYQGWVLAYDAKTLDQLGAFNVVPNDPKGKGGIWHSGGGPAADASGNVFVMTGDGPFDPGPGVDSYSDSVLMLTNGSLTISDYFTPFNQQELENANADMSAAGPLLLPDQSVGPPRLMLSLGKQGIAYLLNRDNLGKFQAGSDSQIVQSFTWGLCGTGRCLIFGTPAYFENAVYMAAAGDKLKAYTLGQGQLVLSGESTNSFSWPGATPVVSANGASNGIVWALETNGSGAPAVLHAYSAADVNIELYNSSENAARDNPGPAIKFSVPTVANGRVYVGSQYQVSVFGLLP
ncbi:MAG: pyrrolo-quinoline quinone [Sulfuricaulis sp.]